MNVTVGVDIEETKRFKLKNGKIPAFFKKIFTPAEIHYCLGKRFPEQHFAARFAAKEATVKALGGVTSGAAQYGCIEIKNSKNQPPVIKFNNHLSKIKSTVQLSMAHTNGTAIAFVVLSRN